jgi:hypothetical protein
MEQTVDQEAIITWSDAGAPLGKLLLVRHGTEVCALRFTKYHREPSHEPQSTLSSGEDSFFAEYEWFYQGDGSADFSKENVRSGRGKVSQGPLRGIGRLSVQQGDNRVRCGPLTLGWMYPTRIRFYLNGRLEKHAIELAPTRWENIKQVKIAETKLHWYRYDESRKPIFIPTDQLD